MSTNIFDLFRRIESQDSAPKQPISAIIAGLGNPGAEYTRTRHNIGFLALDAVAEACGTRIDRSRFHALCGETTIAGRRVLLMAPQTYMNNSGTALREAADFYKIPPEQVYVICDDIALAPGKMRIRRQGSAGGHNGLKSIIEQLSSDAFPRIRVGVGAPPPGGDMIGWVLGKLPQPDAEAVNARISDILPCLTLLLEGKTDQAMNRYNQK